MMDEYACDVCGSNDAAPIEVTRYYTRSEPISVCRNCGFVYARQRPPPERTIAAWANEVFSDTFEDGHYTARGIPAVRARHVYVAEFIAINVGLEHREIVDIGAGEGTFLELLSGAPYRACGFGIEPSAANCERMAQMRIPCFNGSVEAYLGSPAARARGFDGATIVWTLENTGSCLSVMKGAHALVNEGGFLAVATGSRILVPFKKPLHYFLNPQVSTIHPFFFSVNALTNLFRNAGFAIEHVNRFIDTDYLVMIGRALREPQGTGIAKDDWRGVIDFFERWHADTQAYYAGT
jgi:rubredoxin